LIEFTQAEKEQTTTDEDVTDIALRIAAKTQEALRSTEDEHLDNNHNKDRLVRDTAQKIREVDATMTMEGMPLTDEDKERLRDIFDGNMTVERTVQLLIQKHSH
jgi:Na+/phosphate symporter